MEDLTKRQSQILEFVKDFRDMQGFVPTVREIGKRFSITPSGVFDHLKALQTKGYLKRRPSTKRALEIFQAPMVGAVAAGKPITAVQSDETTILLPNKLLKGKNAFLLQVKGQSMSGAGIFDKDTVIVKPQPAAEDGDIVVALLGDETTVKRLRTKKGLAYLEPANPSYKTIKLDKDSKIIGKVTGLLREFKK